MRGYRLTALLRWAGLLGALLLAACGAAESADGRANACDICGGQTGSLVPLCGVTPNAEERGVPESAAGIVVLPQPCGDARFLDALTVRDASGQPIPFTLEHLPNGEILITPASGLTPGSYTVSVGTSSDEDGGVEPSADAGMPVWQQTVDVRSATPLPERFGTVGRETLDCRTILRLTPDPEARPFLGVLSVDVQIDDGAVVPLIITGTMQLFAGEVARVYLPDALAGDLEDGEHELRVIVRLAGESMPLETFVLTLTSPCELSPASYRSSEEAGCSALAPRATRIAWGSMSGALALIAIALRKRRRAAG